MLTTSRAFLSAAAELIASTNSSDVIRKRL
jgi:hypothetical protein